MMDVCQLPPRRASAANAKAPPPPAETWAPGVPEGQVLLPGLLLWRKENSCRAALSSRLGPAASSAPCGPGRAWQSLLVIYNVRSLFFAKDTEGLERCPCLLHCEEVRGSTHDSNHAFRRVLRTWGTRYSLAHVFPGLSCTRFALMQATQLETEAAALHLSS